MNRARLAERLAKAMGIDPVPIHRQNDILPADAQGLPESGYIAALMERGIFKGVSTAYGIGFFPAAEVDRATAAVVFQRAFNLTGDTGSSFADVGFGHWAHGAITAGVASGVWSGIGGGLFDPSGTFTDAHFDIVMSNISSGGVADVNVPGTPAKPSIPGGTGDEDTTAGGVELDEDAIDYVKRWIVTKFDLKNYDEEELTKFATDAVKGLWGPDRQAFEFTLTNMFKQRFGTAIDLWEKNFPDQTAKPTAGMILEFEREAHRKLRAAGLPANFYDTVEELQEIFGAGVDLDELQRRIDLAWNTVMSAPLEVRAWYSSTYGFAGEGVFAANVLDPDRFTELELAEMNRSAAVGGAGSVHGYTLSEQIANRLGGYGVDFARGVEGFGSIKELAPLFYETFGDFEDYTELDEGVEAEFVGGDARRKLERRRRGRLAQFAGGGQAATTNQGVIGLGSAE